MTRLQGATLDSLPMTAWRKFSASHLTLHIGANVMDGKQRLADPTIVHGLVPKPGASIRSAVKLFLSVWAGHPTALNKKCIVIAEDLSCIERQRMRLSLAMTAKAEALGFLYMILRAPSYDLPP